MRKRIFSLILAAIVGFSSVDMAVFAQPEDCAEVLFEQETVQETVEETIPETIQETEELYSEEVSTEIPTEYWEEEVEAESTTVLDEVEQEKDTEILEEEESVVELPEVLVEEDEFVNVAASSSDLNTAVKNKILSYKALYPEGYVWKESFGGGSQCFGFALLMADTVFGAYPEKVRTASNGTTSHGWTCYTVTASNCNSLSVEPGDIIDANGSPHTAMVVSVSNGKILCVQCNWGEGEGKDYKPDYKVYWDRHFNYNKNKSTLAQIVNQYGPNGIECKGTVRLWKPSDSLKNNAQAYGGTGSSSLRISGQSIPSKITQGDSFSCKGTITSNYTITHVGGYILKFEDDEEKIVYSKTVSPNKTSYSLLNNAIDSALLFNKLSAGTYYYKITAHDSSGKKLTLINEPFDVSGSSTLSISGGNYPTSMNIGTEWKSKGTIRSNYNITQVGCYILQIKDGNETIMYSTTIKPEATSYSLDNSEVHNALQFHKLPAGTYYYKITAHDSSGQKGNMVNRAFTVEASESTLSISGETYPETLTQGTAFNSKGIISSNYDIVHVGCYILKIEDGNETVMYSTTLKPNATSFSLDNSEIHNALLFHKLPVGTYYYSITAHDSSDKRSYMIYQPFKVVNPCSFSGNITSPASGQTITAPTVEIQAEAVDSYAISDFIIQVGNEPQIVVKAAKSGNKYTCLYETSIYEVGSNEITVSARCKNGNTHVIGTRNFEYRFPVLTFITDSDAKPDKITYDYQKAFVMPKDPVRAGYIFNGWYTKENGEGVEFTLDTVVTADLTLYAYWTVDDNYYGDVLTEDIPDDGVIPDGIWIAGIDDRVYNGSSIKHSFRVYDENRMLKEKTDYTITYKNNKNAYVYTDEDYAVFEKNLEQTGKRVKVGSFDPKAAPQIIIAMKGNYSGTKILYYNIERADITEESFATSNLTVTYTGKKQVPQPKVTWNGKTLKYGSDYYVAEYDAAKTDKNAFKDAGTYPLTIVGKKNYRGEIPISLTISESKKQIAMSKVQITGIKNMKWDGSRITQSDFTVKYSKDVLSEKDGDYTISWGTNTDVGTGTVTFTGTGTDEDGDGFSYIGSKTVSFKINGTLMNKVSVSGIKASYTYNGEPITPVAVLTYKPSKNADAVPLAEGTHYTTTYTRNVDKGTATILFTGLASGGFSGTKKVTFKIVAAKVKVAEGETTGEDIRIMFTDTENIRDGIYVAPYMKGGVKPKVVVTCGEKQLKEGKDYTVSYSNNTKPALSTATKAPKVTITGKGNYNGSKSEKFTIEAKMLTNGNGITVVAKDKAESSKKNGYRQSFKVYDADGKVLGSKDYDTVNVTYTLIRTTLEDGTVKDINKVLDKNSIVPANSEIRITVKGKGIYAGGEASGTYRILQKNYDISKATIQINNQPYTGKTVLITEQSQFKEGKVYITIGKAKRELILGQDIQVVPGSYVKNINKGTAKVTFRGINDFGGTKTVSFQIGKRSISEYWKGIYAKIVEYSNL